MNAYISKNNNRYKVLIGAYRPSVNKGVKLNSIIPLELPLKQVLPNSQKKYEYIKNASDLLEKIYIFSN